MKKFLRHKEAKKRKLSAINLIKSLLKMNDITVKHKKVMLNHGIWLLTEAEWTNKYNTRYCSKAIFKNAEMDKREKRHDHVFQKKLLVKDLLAAKQSQVEKILENGVACTITKIEHDVLEKYKTDDGWDRYKKARIVVIDRETGKPCKYGYLPSE